MFPDLDYSKRIDSARGQISAAGVDALLLSVGADMPYLSGYEAMPTERLTMLVVPRDGVATLVVPRLEEPRVQRRGDAFAVRAWEESEDPLDIVSDLVAGAGRLAVGDRMWSTFLVGLQQRIAGARFETASRYMAPMRVVKEDLEISLLREAGHAVDRVATRLADVRFSGRTERELSRLVAEMILEEGHDHADFAIVASGPNGASPHHEAGDRTIGEGDSVVVDFGGRQGGYCSDTTRTFSVGEPSAAIADAFAALHEAQAASRATIAPGVTAAEVDAAGRDVISEAGYGDQFIHRTGHGIGLEGHEDPYIIAGSDERLRPGMAFSIEPGIYVTGEFGMRIEDIIVTTADGHESFNRSDRSLRIVG